MQSIDREKLLLLRTLTLPGILFSAWLVAGYVSSRTVMDSYLLFVSQFLLGILLVAVLIKTVPKQQFLEGPSLIFVFCLHVVIYYSASNIIPALLPELRPEELVVPVPPSSVWTYCLATVAAGVMLLGMGVGYRLACRRHQSRFGLPTGPHGWLPGYRLGMLAALALLLLITVGTVQYGIQVGAELLSPEDIAAMTLSQQLFFHGLFSALPVAPLLAAAARVKANSPAQRRLATCLLAVASVLTLAMLLVWGQRSTAIIALAMPLALLASASKASWIKMVVPAMGVMIVVYGGVTVARDSNLVPLLVATPDLSQLSMNDVTTALEAKKSGEQNLASHALADLSYRTAGLEAVASLIQKQFEGQIPFQWGTTTLGGFLQALPVPLRPEPDVASRIKTAPAHLGIFEPGDWVTTLLAELVMDFGPVLLFFPAVLAGMFLTYIDRTLLVLGQRPVLEGLLILRIIFFVFIISNGGSLADMTILLFKATIGYTVLFLILGVVVHRIGYARYRPSSCKESPVG